MTGFLILSLVSMLSLSFGVFIYLKPLRAFEMQKKFYSWINWNIAPISLEKEVRNTRAMGIFLIIFTAGIWLYRIFKM